MPKPLAESQPRSQGENPENEVGRKYVVSLEKLERTDQIIRTILQFCKNIYKLFVELIRGESTFDNTVCNIIKKSKQAALYKASTASLVVMDVKIEK